MLTITNWETVFHDASRCEMSIIQFIINWFFLFFLLFISSADRLVASGGQNNAWPSAHNVQIVLSYPSQGYGAEVTYVSILVNQVTKKRTWESL